MSACLLLFLLALEKSLWRREGFNDECVTSEGKTEGTAMGGESKEGPRGHENWGDVALAKGNTKIAKMTIEREQNKGKDSDNDND